MNNIKMDFGPVIVAGKKSSETGSTVAVRLHQQCITTYPPGTRPQYALQEVLIGAEDKERTVTSVRKATQRLSPDEAERLTIGQEIGGHITRTLRASPRYAGQKPAYEGGYATSTWHKDFVEDIDEREQQKEQVAS